MKYLLVIQIILLLCTLSCGPRETDENKLRSFIASRLSLLEPKIKAMNLADWNANASGEKQYYDEKAKLDLEIKKIYSGKDDFEQLKKFKVSADIKDPLLKREVTILYNSYLGNQIDTVLLQKMVQLNTQIAAKFNTFRGKIDDREVNDNDISSILKTETKSDQRKKAWEASKQVGKEVAPMVIELVKLRNQAAKQLGFENYYAMAMTLSEQDEKEIFGIFDQLKQLTDEPFRQLKKAVDATLSKRYGIKPEQMCPWHYEDPFFQEAPRVGEVDLDKFFKGKNVEELGRKFYAGIGLPVDDILKNSDLYPKKGKYQHAFENDMDRLGDIRVMLSIVDNAYWMGTVLHELGHGVYSKYVDRSLPYLLRVESHTFTTEAIAQLMERQANDANWLQQMVGISEKEKESVQKTGKDNLRLKELVFSRWSQVMLRFERGLYQNPDQDLNKLWWDLVEEYQLVRRPDGRSEPDWAAKIHLAQYPVYYHNYMLGELTASQILNHIVRDVLKQAKLSEVCFADKPTAGEYLKEKIFMPGASLRWDDLIKHATGEPLTPKYFVEEFVAK
jgi:peptidyl-dipeptidase A